MFEIRVYGDPVLRKKAAPVDKFDDEFRVFVKNMVETMVTEDGVGLAAPQVGESLRVVVIDATGGEKPPYVLVNPEIVACSDDKIDADEGCLSLPGITLKVTRSANVTVKALDENGKEYIIENAEGLLAKALQHEIDHLDGIMIVDHVSALKRKMLSGKLKKMAKG